MKMQQVSDHCYAVLNETNLVCDANSGLVNLGDGLVVDTQSDLPHARQMIKLFSEVWTAVPRYVALTHEDIDHVAGNHGMYHLAKARDLLSSSESFIGQRVARA